jgi:hypothetical protein
MYDFQPSFVAEAEALGDGEGDLPLPVPFSFGESGRRGGWGGARE